MNDDFVPVVPAPEPAPAMTDEEIVRGALVAVAPDPTSGDQTAVQRVYKVLSADDASVTCEETDLAGTAWQSTTIVVSRADHEFFSAESRAQTIAHDLLVRSEG